MLLEGSASITNSFKYIHAIYTPKRIQIKEKVISITLVVYIKNKLYFFLLMRTYHMLND